MMKLKQLNKVAGIWMIILLVSLPLYSANALAVTVRITKNTGMAGVNNFINAEGDTWMVEATLTDVQEISPDQVRLQVGALSDPFNSCNEGTLGTVCSYESSLEEGIQEQNYPFTVAYQGVSQSGVINADGTAPLITGLRGEQKIDGTIDLFFTARDEGDGLAVIEVLDDSNAVLQTITVEAGNRELIFNGKLQGINSGEGVRIIKVRAVDRLGHQTLTNGVSFRTDFVAPVIEKVNITAVGRFIGTTAFRSDIVVDLRENSEFNHQLIRVSSPHTSLTNANADSNGCRRDEDEFNLWHCTFSNALIDPAETISFEIYAQDRFGNRATTTKSISYTLDRQAPTVIFFGTERIFDGQSYVSASSSVQNKIVLKFKEEGAGMVKEGIKADLQSVGGSSSEAPDYFNVTTQEASWNFRGGVGGARISLVKLQDLAGNEDPTQLLETGLIIDSTGPRIERLELFGVSDQNEHSFFQSQDQLKVVFTVREESGLQVLVNLDKLVDSAMIKYPAHSNVPAGWMELAHEDGCERLEGAWECNLLVPEQLRSGTGREVDLELKIKDTAGNDAASWSDPRNIERKVSDGKYKIVLLGLSEEEDPDFWEIEPNPKSSPAFVDLDTVSLVPTRIQFNVKLTSPEADAELLGISLGSCEAQEGAPQLRNSLFYGGIEPGGESSPIVNIVLEFEPFDGRTHFNIGADTRFERAAAKYECKLEVFSKLGRRAVRAAEIQSVPLTVDFGFSKVGAIDEGLAQKVKNLQEGDFLKFANVITHLNTVIKILRFIAQLFQIIVSVNQIYDLFGDFDRATVSALDSTPITVVGSQAVKAALLNACFTTQYQTAPSWGWVQWMQIPLGLLSCNPNPTGEFGWYGKWQSTVLDLYNLVSGRGVLGIPADSLYENIYTSAVGLCLPGIIYNVEKAREVHCRRIYCYGVEVPAGYATIESCEKLFDLQMCEFYTGPLVDLSPLAGFSEIGKLIQSLISSPLGYIALTEVIGCAPLCYDPYLPGALTTCKVVTGINKVITIIDNVAGAFASAPTLTGEGSYCGLIKDIKLDELTGGKFIEKETEEKPAEENRGKPSAAPRVQPQTNI